MNIKHTPIALAVGALLAAPLVMAQEDGPLTESYSVNVENSGQVSIDTTVQSRTSQTTNVTANIPVSSKAQAVVDDKQLNTNNQVTNYAHKNNATIGDTAGAGATGNIGVNTASGDNNMQDNAAAIAAADAYFVFGAAESRAMTTQISSENVSQSLGGKNNATIDGGFARASGNIGINSAAGNGNMQKNNLAISVAPSRASMASVQNVQRSMNNVSVSAGTVETVLSSAAITLNGGVSGAYSGTTSGTTTGTSDQIGDVYPDVWTGTTHPGGTQIGHIDLDNQAQGAQDLNQDGGALAFTNSGSYAGTEAGNVRLSGSFSGPAVMATAVVHESENNATLDGNALAGASGNIGVNVASGNGNLQNNSLSLAVSQPPVAAPTVSEIPSGGNSELR
jgi:hypothetical protein